MFLAFMLVGNNAISIIVKYSIAGINYENIRKIRWVSISWGWPSASVTDKCKLSCVML